MQPTTNTTTTAEQQLRSTTIPDDFILQSCICNVNGTCLYYNLIVKDEVFFICIYHDNNHNNGGGTSDSSISTSKTGGGHAKNQLSSLLYHLDHIRSMNITHIQSDSVFDAITSSVSSVDNTTFTYMSPWVTVVEEDSNNLPESNNVDDNTPKMTIRMQQLLNFWFNYQNSNVDIRGEIEVSLLDKEGGGGGGGIIPTLSSFYLTAQLVNDKCRFTNGPDDAVSVSINGGDTIAFACTCDLSNSCYDLNLGLATITTGTPPPSSIIRICVIPQQGNDDVVSVDKIVGIKQLRVEKKGESCGFPFDVVVDGAISPLAKPEVVDDGSMLVTTIKLLPEHVQNPYPITISGAVEVQLSGGQFQEISLGTVQYATTQVESTEMILESCQCDSTYQCIVDPPPLPVDELKVQLCLFSLPQNANFVDGSVDILINKGGNSYYLIVEKSVAVGNETEILFKNTTLYVIETSWDDVPMDRSSLSYVEFISVALLEQPGAFSSDVNSDLRVSLFVEPSSQPSELPSLSSRPTIGGPTVTPTKSSAPTEEQTIKLKYCPCDNNGVCLPQDPVIVTSVKRIINICFDAAPDSATVSPPFVETSLEIDIDFTTEFEADMNGGVIVGEIPLQILESSVGTNFEVLGRFEVSDGPDRNAIVGLSIPYRIESAELSPYCSPTTSTALNACACQCNNDNNCVDGLVQSCLSSRGKNFDGRRVFHLPYHVCTS